MPDIQLLNIDCMEYMATLPDNTFDLAIVDPPYGISATGMNMGDGYCNGKTRQYKGRKNRLHQGAGKLKDRALQKLKSTWDETPPPPRILCRTYPSFKKPDYMGRQLF